MRDFVHERENPQKSVTLNRVDTRMVGTRAHVSKKVLVQRAALSTPRQRVTSGAEIVLGIAKFS